MIVFISIDKDIGQVVLGDFIQVPVGFCLFQPKRIPVYLLSINS